MALKQRFRFEGQARFFCSGGRGEAGVSLPSQALGIIRLMHGARCQDNMSEWDISSWCWFAALCHRSVPSGYKTFDLARV